MNHMLCGMDHSLYVNVSRYLKLYENVLVYVGSKSWMLIFCLRNACDLKDSKRNMCFYTSISTLYVFLALECGIPEDGINTVSVPADLSLNFGDQYMYTCLCGFEPALSGQEMVTECTEDGSFSLQPPPNCTGMH